MGVLLPQGYILRGALPPRLTFLSRPGFLCWGLAPVEAENTFVTRHERRERLRLVVLIHPGAPVHVKPTLLEANFVPVPGSFMFADRVALKFGTERETLLYYFKSPFIFVLLVQLSSARHCLTS